MPQKYAKLERIIVSAMVSLKCVCAYFFSSSMGLFSLTFKRAGPVC